MRHYELIEFAKKKSKESNNVFNLYYPMVEYGDLPTQISCAMDREIQKLEDANRRKSKLIRKQML